MGRGGDNVKFIQQETGCKVQIKGRGSGFMEPQSGRESDEPMYLHIAFVYLLPSDIAHANRDAVAHVPRVFSAQRSYATNSSRR